MQSGSKRTAGESQTFFTSWSRPISAATAGTASKSLRSITSSTASSGWRKSTVKKTWPGITLRELGLTSTRPTVPTAEGRMLQGDPIDPLDDARCPEQSILAQVHRRRAGMGLAPGQLDLVPAHALHAGDDADDLLLGLEDRPLLDMEFEHGAELDRAGRRLAAIADALDGLGEGRRPGDPARLSAKARSKTPA